MLKTLLENLLIDARQIKERILYQVSIYVKAFTRNGIIGNLAYVATGHAQEVRLY